MRLNITADGRIDGRILNSRVVMLAIMCSLVSTPCNVYNINSAVVLAFSPTYPRTKSLHIHHDITSSRNSIVNSAAMNTKLAYKNLHNEDEDDSSIQSSRNETAILPRVIDVSVDVNLDIQKNVIHYNDLDDEPVDAISSSSYNVSFTDSSSNQDMDSLIGEGGDGIDSSSSTSSSLTNDLEDVIKQKNIYLNQPKAIEPTKSKPSKKFVSPIEMMKKVPKVEPIHMSTVFFLQLINDPMWPTTEEKRGSSAGGSSTTAFVPPPKTNKPREPWINDSNKSKVDFTSNKKPMVESWKTKINKSNAFQATSYLESLSSANNANKKDDDNASNKNEKDNEADLLRSLRDQQAQFIESQKQAMQEAMREANRRTKEINEEVIEKRIEDEHQERKKNERDQLERLYIERKERLDAKKMMLEDAVAKDTSKDAKEVLPFEITSKNGKRGIPILDILSRPPVVDAPPLLVGSTLTYRYSDLTPFQKRAVDVAKSNHEEHCQRMKDEEDDTNDIVGSDGGIQASPIIAIIDSYTAFAIELPTSPHEKTSTTQQRYATLASIEIIENSNDGEPSVVKFMGVGRVLLHDYFSSKNAGLSEEEEELSKIMDRLQEFDKEELDEEDGNDTNEEDDDNKLPVVMAEFNIVLDDSSIVPDSDKSTTLKPRMSSMHAVTELYRTANKLYRLHEERKKLVAGLRAGQYRLYHGKKKLGGGGDGNCPVEFEFEFEDCDGLGLISVVDGDASSNFEDVGALLGPIRSELPTMENYGFGSYGVFSTIPDLTQQLMANLEPYYSQTYREREEYEAEVASMVIFQTLKEYATPQEMAAALLTSSATKRLELGYEIMLRHKNELNDLVKIVSEKLIDCGEECTDLW